MAVESGDEQAIHKVNMTRMLRSKPCQAKSSAKPT